MYFAKTDRLHEMEKLMSGIPNFSPRGQGKTVLQCEIDGCMKEQPPPDNYADVLKATMIAIHNQPFLERLESLIKESESETVMYRNEKHQRVFEESIGKCDEKNYAFLSAVYLMTADFKLWQKVKAEKFAKIISKTIILSGMDLASLGQNAYFYESAEGLLTATILLVAEFCEPKKRHMDNIASLRKSIWIC